jgi:hypothetical protein
MKAKKTDKEKRGPVRRFFALWEPGLVTGTGLASALREKCRNRCSH